ncbi:gap-Pol polyprotein, partial [Clonorchis sinensis]
SRKLQPVLQKVRHDCCLTVLLAWAKSEIRIDKGSTGGPRKMDWAAAKEALAAEFDATAYRQESTRRFKTARMAPGCEPTVFFASLQQSLDRALPGLDGASRHQLLSDQFVEGVQPALGAQLRLARATGQLSVERLVHLGRELTEAPLATFQSQENRQDSTVEDLKNKVGQPTEQLAAVKTESRRQARTSRCYKCGMPGHLRNQCPRTRPEAEDGAPRIMIGTNSLVVELDPGRLVQLQRQDPVLQKVAAALLDGRSIENGEGDKELEKFHNHIDRLSLSEAGIMFYNTTYSDVVLLVITRVSGLGSRNLSSHYRGLFVVTDRQGNVYAIQDGRRSKRVNGTQLRMWDGTPEELPSRPAAEADLTEVFVTLFHPSQALTFYRVQHDLDPLTRWSNGDGLSFFSTKTRTASCHCSIPADAFTIDDNALTYSPQIKHHDPRCSFTFGFFHQAQFQVAHARLSDLIPFRLSTKFRPLAIPDFDALLNRYPLYPFSALQPKGFPSGQKIPKYYNGFVQPLRVPPAIRNIPMLRELHIPAQSPETCGAAQEPKYISAITPWHCHTLFDGTLAAIPILPLPVLFRTLVPLPATGNKFFT